MVAERLITLVYWIAFALPGQPLSAALSSPAPVSVSVAGVQCVGASAGGLLVVTITLAFEAAEAKSFEIVLGESLRVA